MGSFFGKLISPFKSAGAKTFWKRLGGAVAGSVATQLLPGITAASVQGQRLSQTAIQQTEGQLILSPQGSASQFGPAAGIVFLGAAFVFGAVIFGFVKRKG